MKPNPSIPNPATEPLLDRHTLDRLLSIVDGSQRQPGHASHNASGINDPAPHRETLASFYPHRQSKGGAQ